MLIAFPRFYHIAGAMRVRAIKSVKSALISLSTPMPLEESQPRECQSKHKKTISQNKAIIQMTIEAENGWSNRKIYFCVTHWIRLNETNPMSNTKLCSDDGKPN